MHVHILGIGGTFMGGIAALAQAMGHRVSGSDLKIYPPMSTQLKNLNIEVLEGYEPAQLKALNPDCIVVGNGLSRGNPVVEMLLSEGRLLVSGPQWLHENVLNNRWVLAVAGTHGKTTTSSMLAWILEYAGLKPGFLIGGVPGQFEVSARLGETDFFVVEADEYDTAFFDKRSKFVHYWPKTCIINNLEFDHADIFNNLAEIQKQFHHLVRLVPKEGLIIYPEGESAIEETLEKGCWSARESFSLGQGDWQANLTKEDGSTFSVHHRNKNWGTVTWDLLGKHNVKNALAAMAASHHVGVLPEVAIQALNEFQSPKRRLEYKGAVNQIEIYDDFAHHPTAIQTTLEALRAKVQGARIGVLLDIRSNTMRLGTHQATLLNALKEANLVAVFQSDDVKWPVKEILEKREGIQVFNQESDIVRWFKSMAQPLDHWIIMSNGSFNQVHQKLLEAF